MSSVALFSSAEKAKVFVPDSDQKRCMTLSSKTGKLVDIDVEIVKTALEDLVGSKVFA